jgi:ATP-dependent Clp protease adaptor protein ClpS
MNKEAYNNKTIQKTAVDKDLKHILVLLNDEVHTFEYVIDALTDLCDHTSEQAIQCTMITHYKGKCDIKKGSFAQMIRLRRALTARDLQSVIHPSIS